MLNSLFHPSAESFFWLMLLHCLIGLMAGIVADTKGYSFLNWLIFGLIGGTISLIFSVRLPKREYK